MINLPFFNRKRYIVLECYTWHPSVLKYSAISLGHPSAGKIDSGSFLTPQRSFRSCYSRLANRKKSATVFTPCDIRFEVIQNGSVQHTHSTEGVEDLIGIDYKHDADVSYKTHSDVSLAKIIMPWRIKEETGTNFVIAKHIHNTTLINIASGITSFTASSSLNLFAHIPNVTHRFVLPHLTPLIGLYPMSDKPLHVETYHDADKWADLGKLDAPLKFKASGIKANPL